MRMTISPSLCSKPSTGGLSVARVPRPRLPFKRLRRAFRPAFATSAGNPLCPATIYTSSASISPLSWTGFFYPLLLDATNSSSLGRRQTINPVLQLSVHSKGSAPSGTDIVPTPAMVGDALRKSCHLDHRIVAHTRHIYIVGAALDDYGNHASGSLSIHTSGIVPHLTSVIRAPRQNIWHHQLSSVC